MRSAAPANRLPLAAKLCGGWSAIPYLLHPIPESQDFVRCEPWDLNEASDAAPPPFADEIELVNLMEPREFLKHRRFLGDMCVTNCDALSAMKYKILHRTDIRHFTYKDRDLKERFLVAIPLTLAEARLVLSPPLCHFIRRKLHLGSLLKRLFGRKVAALDAERLLTLLRGWRRGFRARKKEADCGEHTSRLYLFIQQLLRAETEQDHANLKDALQRSAHYDESVIFRFRDPKRLLPCMPPLPGPGKRLNSYKYNFVAKRCDVGSPSQGGSRSSSCASRVTRMSVPMLCLNSLSDSKKAQDVFTSFSSRGSLEILTPESSPRVTRFA